MVEITMLYRILFTITAISFLIGCQTATQLQPVATQEYLHDHLFPDHNKVAVETLDEVFAIDQSMKDFVNEHVKIHDNQKLQIRTLAEGVFEHADFSLLYQNNANTTAAETFRNRAANCLSLTIMTYALAEYAGFGVDFQQVDIPELWVRRDGASMLNRHVNLKLFEKHRNPMVVVVTKHDFTVDFNQMRGNRWFAKRVITKDTVLSMFYNNKGVDALVEKDFNTAYAYFKQGILTDPYQVDNYTNLGLLYRWMGYDELAEKNYMQSLTIAPEDGTTLENLAVLYRLTGRESEAEKIELSLRNKRRENPYYHFLQGEEALEKNELSEALKHFRNAIQLQEKNHEFYFAMAKTLFLMGEKERSKYYLKLAKKHSRSHSEQLLYQEKLNSYSHLDY
jgi:tetratricopeptide (TPR) repeat protein